MDLNIITDVQNVRVGKMCVRLFPTRKNIVTDVTYRWNALPAVAEYKLDAWYNGITLGFEPSKNCSIQLASAFTLEK